MRKISQTDVNGSVSEVNNSSPKNIPGSPNPRGSISSNKGNNNNSGEEKQKQQPGTPTEDKRPERIARFKKNSINVGESLLRGENQTTRQPTTGNTEIKGFGLSRQHSRNDNSQSVIDIDNTSSSDNRNSSMD